MTQTSSPVSEQELLAVLRKISLAEASDISAADVAAIVLTDEAGKSRSKPLVILTLDTANLQRQDELRHLIMRRADRLGIALDILVTPQENRKMPDRGAAKNGSPNIAVLDTGKSKEAPKASEPLLPSVKHVIAVASGKGGVGKSTVAANLAVALAQRDIIDPDTQQKRPLRIGLLDADIYGPSVPMLMGVQGQQPTRTAEDKIAPLMAHSVSVMSIGLLVDTSSAMIWRGPMVQSALMQMMRDVDWPPLDILILDMPPGTGDAQLTIAQKLQLSGAVIVSTPQDLAMLDVVRGITMFDQTAVPILGLVSNMSYFKAPDTGKRYDLFGQADLGARCSELGISHLAALPLVPSISAQGDQGRPLSDPESQKIFKNLAQRVHTTVLDAMSQQRQAPILRFVG